MKRKNILPFILVILFYFFTGGTKAEAASYYKWSKYSNIHTPGTSSESKSVVRSNTITDTKTGSIPVYGYPSYEVYSSLGTPKIRVSGSEDSIYTSIGVSGTRYQSSGSDSSINEYRYVGNSDGSTTLTTSILKPVINVVSTPATNTRGSLVQSNVQASYDAYLHNQLNSDGFWWVRGEAVDSTPPIGTVTQSPTSFTNQNVTITVTGTDSESGMKQVKLPNGSYSSSSSITHTVSANGTYTFVFEDNEGNTSSKSITVSNIDRTNPTGTLTQNSSSWTAGSVTITASGSDTGGSGFKRIRKPDGSYANSASTTYNVTTNSTYTFVFEDNAGNTDSRTITVSNIDKTNPTATFTPNGNSTYKKSHTTILTSADSESGVNTRQYTWSSSNTTTPTTWSNFTEGQNLTAPSAVTGSRYLWVKVSDTVGNELVAKSNVFRLDNTAPSGTITGAPTAWQNGNAVLTIVATDGHSGVKRIQTPDGAWVTGSTTTYEVSADGTYEFIVEDTAGNTKMVSETVTNKIDKTIPTATFTPNGNTIYKKTHTTKLATSDNHSGVNTRQYAWSSSSTTTPSTWANFTEGQNISTPNGVTGNRYLWVKVTDNAGNELITKSNVFRLDNTAPTVTFTPESREADFKDIDVQVSISDTGGSNYKQTRHVWTKDELRPTEGWSDWDTSSSPLLKQDKGGKWFLHIEAEDAAGNMGYAYSGIYEKIIISGGPSININVFPVPTGVWLNQPIDVYVMESGDADLLAKAKKYYSVTNNPLYPSSFSSMLPNDKKVLLNLQGENFIHIQYILDDGTKISATSGPYLIDTGSIADFEMKLTNTAGVEVTNWTNQNLRLVIGNPTTSLASGFTKQYRIEGLHEDWQTYQDGMTIATEGDYRIFGRILSGTGKASIQKVVNAKIDKTMPTISHLRLIKTTQNRYDVLVKADDSFSGIKEVKLNNGTLLSRGNNGFEGSGLTTKPTSATVHDHAGNFLAASFVAEPVIAFDAPYTLTTPLYQSDAVAKLSNATGYILGNRAYSCTTNPCTVTVSYNTTLTAVRTEGIKETRTVVKISNIDQSELRLILTGKRSNSKPQEITFSWNYELTNAKITCQANSQTNTYPVTGKTWTLNGQNTLYLCTLSGSYKGVALTSEQISIYPDGMDAVAGSDVTTNIYFEQTRLGKSYIINAKKHNYKYSSLPIPQNDITAN